MLAAYSTLADRESEALPGNNEALEAANTKRVSESLSARPMRATAAGRFFAERVREPHTAPGRFVQNHITH